MLMSLTPRITPGMTRKVAAACGAGVLLIGATACGSSTSSTPQAQSYNQAGSNGQTTQGGGFPGADGKVAAVSGSTAQIQSQASGQVAVTWTSATTFTKQVSAALKDVKVGDCVMVQPVADGSASSGSSSATTQPTAVTAATVRITTKTGGSCTGGFAGGPGGGGPQVNGTGPGGAAPQPPAGVEGGLGGPGGTAPGGGPQFRSLGAFGEVTAVSGTGFTVRSTRPAIGSTSATTTDVAVTVSSTTTYVTTAKGKAADVVVGSCIRANGTTDSTGAITARTVAISPTTNGLCGSLAFRRGNGTGSTTTLGS